MEVALALDRELIRQVRRLDEYDLRRLVIFARGLLLYRDGRFAEPLEDPAAGDGGTRVGAVSYRRELVRCGRSGCRSCPHGPYWYAYWRQDGRMRSRYIGKDLLAPAGEPQHAGRRRGPRPVPPAPQPEPPAS